MRREMIKKIFMACLLTTVLAGCDIFQSGQDQTETPPPSPPMAKVSFSAAPETIHVGESFARTVEVQNVGNTFYVAFDLTYDPGVIEYVSPAEGAFLNKNGSDSTSYQVALQDGQPGRLVVSLTRLGPIGEVSGSGTLLILSFKAVGPGNTTLAFENPKGFRTGADQDVTIDVWENGTVTVQ